MHSMYLRRCRSRTEQEEKTAMKKWYPRVAGAAALVIALGLVLLIRVKTAKGSPQDIFSGDSGCISYVPEEWGQFIGSSALTGIGFEDKDGTLRFVTSLPCGYRAGRGPRSSEDTN
jgi:hypothetical protein